MDYLGIILSYQYTYSVPPPSKQTPDPKAQPRRPQQKIKEAWVGPYPGSILGLYGDNGKNGNYYNGIYRGYIGVY